MTARKRVLIAAVVIMAVLLTLKTINMTGWGKAVLFPVTRVVREVVAPVQSGITTMIRGINDFFVYFGDTKALHRENLELTKRLTELEDKLYQLKEQESENERLLKLLKYQETKQTNYELVMARVISRDPGNWYKTIIVDKGSEQGIKKYMTAVNHDGLVGMVIGVTKNTSEVLLILDSEAAVGARVFENRVTPGVVTGLGKSNLLQMIHLPHDVPIEPGHTIVSSGLGGLYPKGIRIGTVAEVNISPDGLMKNALIKPFVDFDRLEEIFIILQVRNPEADMQEVRGGIPQ